MKLLCGIHGLLLNLLINYTHALTLPLGNLTSPLSREGDIECLNRVSPWYSRTNYSKYYDCKRALEHLPGFPGFGVFHNHGPEDPFSLPVEFTFETCTANVELRAGTAVQSGSWNGIRVAAEKVNIGCIGMFAPGGYVGGWTTLGKQERIVVVLRSSKELGNG